MTEDGEQLKRLFGPAARFISPNRANVVAMVVGLVATAGLVWGYGQTMAARSPGGTIHNPSDIPPEVQAVLQQAPAPTHDKPTPWGLFVINPVINGEALLNPQESPAPDLSGPSARAVEGAGETTLAEAAAKGVPTIDVPIEFRKEMPLIGMHSTIDGAKWIKYLYFGSGDGTEDYQSLEIQAITPTHPIPFTEFPDNAIRDFSANYDVRGNPTLTEFPDKGTADPRSERIVAWSQGEGAYIVRTTGQYTDAEVLELARHISLSEDNKR